MRRMILACLLVCVTACGGPGPAADPPRDPSTTGAEGDLGRRTPGQSEHECALRRQRECASLACRWVDDPDATAAPTASSPGEDTSLRDDVTIGPRRAAFEGEGRLCVQPGDDGATTACPEICCSVCPRE